MLDIVELVLRQERLLRALTGLNRKAFEALMPKFSEVYEQTRQTQPPRARSRWRTQSAIADDGSKTIFYLVLLQVLPNVRSGGSNL